MTTPADDELRALDREMAELMGWKWWITYEPDDDDDCCDLLLWHADDRPKGYKPARMHPDGRLWTDHFCDSCLRRVPRYSSTWEGFGLLVEEIERQGWDHFTERSEAMGCGIGTVNRNDGPRDWAMMPPRHTCIGIDIRHALALAARDAFRAKKEAEGVKK